MAARSLKKVRILITAGPTHEALDPVRYLTNASSGLLGYTMATELKKMGAQVRLISGPVSLSKPLGVKFHSIQTAQQMFQLVKKHIATAQVFISTAAVADYRFAHFFKKKLKKNKTTFIARFVKNPDILQTVGIQKKKKGSLTPLLIGFALETNALEKHARRKLKQKNLDLIIGNSTASFGSTSIQPLWLEKNRVERLPRISKQALAKKVGVWIGSQIYSRPNF